MARITQLQHAILVRANSAHGRASTWWMSGQIETKTTYRGCRQLLAKGLLSRDVGGYWPLWTITDAGRQALAALQSPSTTPEVGGLAVSGKTMGAA